MDGGNWSGKRDSNPRPSAWKADATYELWAASRRKRRPVTGSRESHYTSRWWRGKDSNLRRLSRQIYSLLPLTAREPLRPLRWRDDGGAGEGTRTPNRLITNEMLYQLSYASAVSPFVIRSARRLRSVRTTRSFVNDRRAPCGALQIGALPRATAPPAPAAGRIRPTRRPRPAAPPHSACCEASAR